MSSVGSITWAITVFQSERSCFLREASGGYYTNFAYFLSKTLFEFPAPQQEWLKIPIHIHSFLLISIHFYSFIVIYLTFFFLLYNRSKHVFMGPFMLPKGL